jgi:uncharacterized coiled-coil protein SlyX
MKTAPQQIKHSITCLPFRHLFGLITFAGLVMSPITQAVNPAPDGGYVNRNTAEGDFALQNLTTGSDNTAVGNGALFGNTSGLQNTATGRAALFNNTTGFQNVADGFASLFSNTTGFHNTAIGIGALVSNTTGNHNTANGDIALVLNTTGNFNTVEGAHALVSNTIGSFNIAVGVAAGENLTGDNNIDISNEGVAVESNTIRIGNEVAFTDHEGIMHAAHSKTFIAGVAATTTIGGAAVFVDSSGQLGTMTSSARFKREIEPMDKASEAVFALKPVTFRYKRELDPTGMVQFGLVAEDVLKVNPGLIVRDKEGKPHTVRYDAVNAMMLNEFLKEHRTVQEQEATIAQLESAVAKQEATAAQQQKQIKALTAGLQKVSTQLQLNKSAPQTVVNNQ